MTSVNVTTTKNTVSVTGGDSAVVTVATAGPQGPVRFTDDGVYPDAIGVVTGEVSSGTSATVTIGTVTTGAAGSSAIVANSGTSSAAVFDFTIPQGLVGVAGVQGVAGPQGPAGANGGTDIVLDTTPQLGGDLDMNSKFISSGTLGVKNAGTQSELQLYCEVNNQHYAAIKAPAHADFSGNLTFTLPSGYGSANQVLTTDGSGGTSWAAASGGMSRAQTTAVALIFG